MTPHELLRRWREDAAVLTAYDDRLAAIARRHADELEAALAADEDVVTIHEAHLLGGYSIDHLQRLVSKGRIENMGRRGSPRIRRRDVPIRPGHANSPLPNRDEQTHISRRRQMALAVITSAAGGT